MPAGGVSCGPRAPPKESVDSPDEGVKFSGRMVRERVFGVLADLAVDAIRLAVGALAMEENERAGELIADSRGIGVGAARNLGGGWL